MPNVGVTLAGPSSWLGILLFVLFLDRVHPPAAAGRGRGARRGGGPQGARRGARGGGAARRARRRRTSRTRRAGEPALVVRCSAAGSIQAIDMRGLVQVGARARVPSSCCGTRSATSSPAGLGADRGVRPAPRRRRSSAQLRGDGRARGRADDRAGSGVRAPDHGRHRASVALSPAVNDPTTAVQVLDHLGETLRAQIGTIDLSDDGRCRSTSVAGGARRSRVRRWEDFLTLGVTEIREYGATSIQVRAPAARDARGAAPSRSLPGASRRRCSASSHASTPTIARAVGDTRSTSISQASPIGRASAGRRRRGG